MMELLREFIDRDVAYLVLGVLSGIVLLVLIYFIHRRTRRLDRDFFAAQWQSIEEMASNQATWVQAIVDADKLMDEALKQSHFAGKTTADRMVNANRAFSRPDQVWSAHKIRNKVVHETKLKLRKQHVNWALKGFKSALKDLGAL